MRWLLDHQGDLQYYLWLGAFGAVGVWESLHPRRALQTSTVARWSINVALTAFAMPLTALCMPVAAFSAAQWAQANGWGVLNLVPVPAWIAGIMGVLAFDLWTYAVHRWFHHSALLWRLHKIHHADLDVDCTTSFRHHPGEFLVVTAANLAIIAAIGVPPLAVVVALTCATVVSVLNHGNVAAPDRLDRVLRSIIVSPDMHRIHHSMQEEECNSNYGGIFSWWDRLFGTYVAQPQLGHDAMRLGISEAPTAADVSFWRLLALPFRPAPVAVRA